MTDISHSQVHPLFVVVGYVPTLVVAAICVYIGVDFLWDNLVAPGITLEVRQPPP